MAVQLLEFVSDGERADDSAEVVEILGLGEVADATPFRVAGERVVSAALDV